MKFVLVCLGAELWIEMSYYYYTSYGYQIRGNASEQSQSSRYVTYVRDFSVPCKMRLLNACNYSIICLHFFLCCIILRSCTGRVNYQTPAARNVRSLFFSDHGRYSFCLYISW